MKKNNLRIFGLITMTVLVGCGVPAAGGGEGATPKPGGGPGAVESAPQREVRLAWFREARFGMFIHWGPYAALGGEYQGKPVGWIAEWIQHTARIPFKEYEDVAASFNPVKFDARQWVGIAKDAGMKYIAITSKHHDGFCLWDSKLTSYNIAQFTQFKRDVIVELARECQKAGLRFGVYYSVRDWHHPDWTLRYAHLERPNIGWGFPASRWTGGRVLQCGCPSCRKDRPMLAEMDPRPTDGVDMNRYLDYMKGQGSADRLKEVGRWMLPDDARQGIEVSFPPKKVKWLIFAVTAVKPGSRSIGLAEIAVFRSKP